MLVNPRYEYLDAGPCAALKASGRVGLGVTTLDFVRELTRSSLLLGLLADPHYVDPRSTDNNWQDFDNRTRKAIQPFAASKPTYNESTMSWDCDGVDDYFGLNTAALTSLEGLTGDLTVLYFGTQSDTLQAAIGPVIHSAIPLAPTRGYRFSSANKDALRSDFLRSAMNVTQTLANGSVPTPGLWNMALCESDQDGQSKMNVNNTGFNGPASENQPFNLTGLAVTDVGILCQFFGGVPSLFWDANCQGICVYEEILTLAEVSSIYDTYNDWLADTVGITQ